MEKNVKITVVGIGGVGGYISGMLAKTYENVTLVARGARKKSLEKEGICLHSQYNGEITAKAKRVVESLSLIHILTATEQAMGRDFMTAI